jgi:hypothetical protein
MRGPSPATSCGIPRVTIRRGRALADPADREEVTPRTAKQGVPGSSGQLCFTTAYAMRCATSTTVSLVRGAAAVELAACGD